MNADRGTGGVTLMFCRSLFTSVGLFVLLSASAAFGQCADKQLSKFFSQDPNYLYYFGFWLDVSGSRMTLSSQSLGTTSYLHVYDRQQAGDWVETAVMSTPGVAFQNVAIDGDIICVGKQNGGLAHVYEYVAGNWVGPISLVQPAPVTSGFFGHSVVISSGRIFVGDPPGQAPTNYLGSVYVFEKQGASWSCVATINPTVPKPGGFGSTLAVDDKRLVVGAYAEQTSLPGAGAAYVFDLENNTWTQKARLAAPFAGASGVGYSIAVSGDRILLGCGAYGLSGALMFEKNGPFWAYSANLLTADPSASTGFGTSVALSATQAFVSDPTYDGGAAGGGAVFVFDKLGSGWENTSTLTPADKKRGAFFGSAIDITAAGLVASAPHAVGITQQSGAVYEMKTTSNAPSEYGTSCPGSGGFQSSFTLPQSYDACVFPGTSLTFSVAGGLGGSSALILIGLSPVNTVVQNGCSVLVSPIVVVVPVPLFGSGPGNGAVSFGATVPMNVGAGSVYLQAITIDAGAHGGFAASNGLRVTVN